MLRILLEDERWRRGWSELEISRWGLWDLESEEEWARARAKAKAKASAWASDRGRAGSSKDGVRR